MDDLSSLRSILVGPEQRGVAGLQARLDDPERRARDIGAVLPQVLMQHAQDPEFARALTPSLQKAITSSVQRNPRPLADALFPIMGPAIRKAVAAALAGMVESFSRTLEHSFSRRAIGWRIEAFRTGRSFAEVVLLKTLLYRVEQVFLIHRETGLLLQHAQGQAEGARDADMVSGMLTAIRDFVKDSFEVRDQASLESLQVGDLQVWIEAGPHAIVAAVIRGGAPPDYRRRLEEAVEAVHLQFGETLSAFKGDASAFEDSRPILESCIEVRFLSEERARRGRAAPIVLALAGVAVVAWLSLSIRDRVRWERYLEALRAQPGLVVVSAERSGGRFTLTGLRDPLATDVEPLRADVGLSPGDVLERWTPYQALDPEIVLARAEALLSPPPGVSLSLADGVLSSDGPAPGAWLAETRRLAPFVAGVHRFDASESAAAGLRAAVDALESEAVLFPTGDASPSEGQGDVLGRLVAAVGQLAALADVSGLRFRVDVVGHTDDDGLPETNQSLSRARAEGVRDVLMPAATPALDIVASGVGSTQPAAAGRTEADMVRNRRVSIRVTPLE